jgi:hypothetical protein
MADLAALADLVAEIDHSLGATDVQETSPKPSRKLRRSRP